ncbi:hypothetical protein KFE98_19675 [bacterium SCSIO 12741]|nr:hypothetical protein KFE98_19675 [bacterium SCSIO 12741]
MMYCRNGVGILFMLLFFACFSGYAQSYPAPADFKVFVQPTVAHTLSGKNATQISDSLKNGEMVDLKILFNHNDSLALDSIVVDLIDNSGPVDSTVSHQEISLKQSSVPAGLTYSRSGDWCILKYSAFALRRKMKIEIRLVDNDPTKTSQGSHQFQL